MSEPDLSVFVAPLGVTRVEVAEWSPRFNLAPTQLAPLITNEASRRLILARFGLVPSWTDPVGAGAKFINARIETIGTRKAFRRPLALRRGLVPVNGYLEWRTTHQGKQPVFIFDPTGAPLLLTAIWECWHARQGPLAESFALVTQPASGPIKEIHARMPVLLSAQDVGAWLAPEERDHSAMRQLLEAQHESERLHVRQVSRLVNSVRNDSAACLEAPTEAHDQRQLDLFAGIAPPSSQAR